MLLTLIGFILTAAMDSVYLTLNAGMYKPILDPRQKLNLVYGVLAWLTIAVSIRWIVLSRPDVTRSNVFSYGAMLGFAMYALYNFTNASTYPDKWSNTIILGDTAWGTLLTGTVAYAMFRIKKMLG
jgi:uncharacterized membrane protein